MLDSYRNSVFRYVWNGCVRNSFYRPRETMGEDWKELDVLSSLQAIENPPYSMWLVEDHEERWERCSAIIREHYNEILEELRDGGYDRLVTMKDRLESHLSEVEDRLLKWRGRVLHSQLQHKAYGQRLLNLAAKKAPEGAGTDKVGDEMDALLDTPIGEPWYTDGAVELDFEGNWRPGVSTHHPDSEATLSESDMTIRYEATEDALPQFGLHQRYEKYDSASFHDEHTRSFTGDTTWREAFGTLEEYRDANMERKNRVAKTKKLLRFRLSIVETILYRFETFGSVERLAEEEAQDIAEESQPGRKSTLNDPEAHPSRMLKAVLEWTREDTNRRKPFRSEVQESLCGFLSKRLEEKVGYPVPQDTIKTRLRSIMDEMGVQLPHGHTNILSYFEAREEITEAMQKHDLV